MSAVDAMPSAHPPHRALTDLPTTSHDSGSADVTIEHRATSSLPRRPQPSTDPAPSLPTALPPARTQSHRARGRAVVRSHPASGPIPHLLGSFETLHFTFPLKLLHPRLSSTSASLRCRSEVTPRAVSVLYVVSYGGGLVSGDEVLLDIDVGQRCTLLLLTQGSTKVFKMRDRSQERATSLGSHRSLSSSSSPTPTTTSRASSSSPWIHPQLPTHLQTRQSTRFLIRPESTLVLLPDPVTCFAKARYVQTQRFDVRCPSTSSLVLLDWFTPGRVHLRRTASPMHRRQATTAIDEMEEDDKGSVKSAWSDDAMQDAKEAWAFESYRSRNEIRVAGHLLARDVLLLENPEGGFGRESKRENEEEMGRGRKGATTTTTTTMDSDGIKEEACTTTWTAPPPRESTLSTLASRSAPYTTYATLLLLGPCVQGIISGLIPRFEEIQQRVLPAGSQPERVLWSLTQLKMPPKARKGVSGDGKEGIEIVGGGGAPSNHSETQSDTHPPHAFAPTAPSASASNNKAILIRIAGYETEDVRKWLRTALDPLRDVVGSDLVEGCLGRG